MYRQEKCNEKKGDSLNWFVLLDTLPITVGMLYISTLVDLLLTHLKTFLKFATATRASSFIISEFLNGQITSNLLCLKLATSRYQKEFFRRGTSTWGGDVKKREKRKKWRLTKIKKGEYSKKVMFIASLLTWDWQLVRKSWMLKKICAHILKKKNCPTKLWTSQPYVCNKIWKY